MNRAPSQKRIGTFLKQHRVKAGLTQSDVAQKLGYTSPQFISNIERGLCSAPVKHLKDFAKMYNVNTEELIQLLLTEHESVLRSALNMPVADKEKRVTGGNSSYTN
jgi:transcriptional regulator with XRE-family HTH domain